MLKINLIPPEILQSRRNERIFKWVGLLAVLIFLVLATFWSTMFIQMTSVNNTVVTAQKQESQLQSEISLFMVFQQTAADVSARRAIVSTAAEGRIDWARMFSELGLILPDDIYLTAFTGAENPPSGTVASIVTMAGKVVDAPAVVSSRGSESVAHMLVRLADMKQFDSVWLTNMNLMEDPNSFESSIQWTVSARIQPSSATSATVN